MDEPLTSIDQECKDRIMPYLFDFIDKHNVLALYVSYDPSEVSSLSSSILTLSDGKGRMISY